MKRDDGNAGAADAPGTGGAGHGRRPPLIAALVTLALYLAFAHSVLGAVEPEASPFTPAIYDPIRLLGLFNLVLVVGFGIDPALGMGIVCAGFLIAFGLVFLLSLWLVRLVLDAPRRRAEMMAKEAAKAARGKGRE